MIFGKSIRNAVFKKVEKKIADAQAQYYSEAKEIDSQATLTVAKVYLEAEEKKESIFNRLVNTIIQ